ncbi:uncharacterized protein LOC133152636 [Syngnathus typhle]|uniref:uncharacterized protein LOC133152636 n=1 Tax=Syngnathus typhle TaxID=161592 RepID=UPI002A6A6AE9|nr:uncharacterized protein LOC133152636 [Syngnathus typhle]
MANRDWQGGHPSQGCVAMVGAVTGLAVHMAMLVPTTTPRRVRILFLALTAGVAGRVGQDLRDSATACSSCFYGCGSRDTFKFLGTTISRDLKWTGHIDSVRKKAQQRLYFLRQLKKFNLPQELLKTFYTAIIQSVFCTSITVWFGSASKQDKHRLQRTIRTAEKIIGINLPSIQDLYLSRTRKRATSISTDPSHPGCSLFELLPSGRRYRAWYAKTSRHRDNFFPQAVALMNSRHS